MTEKTMDMNELHWLMDMIQTIDVGLIVINQQYQVEVWNTFMENHSNLSSDCVRNKVLFDLFPDTDLNWIKHKINTVYKLKNRAFSTWEQRPYLFKFNNYRPITGTEEFMYQNISIIPLASADGSVNNICLIIYDVTDIVSQRKELDNINQELEELSRTDTMTSLYNRRYWDECLNTEYLRFQRNTVPITLIMYDIDDLEDINREHSFKVGDKVIQEVAKLLKSTQRDTDFSCRFAGKQFAIILSNVNEKSARIFAERLRSKVANHQIKIKNKKLQVTISLGIAELTEDYDDPVVWVKSTKYALQHAKNKGKNQTILYSTI